MIKTAPTAPASSLLRTTLIAAALIAAPLTSFAQDGYGGGGYAGGYGAWSGPYVSGTLAFGHTSTSSDASGPTISVSDTATAYALALGRHYQSGSLVYGGEVALFDVAGDLGEVGNRFGVDYGLRLSGRLGYDMGRAMAYGTLGLARADFAGAGINTDDTALTLGAGLDMRVTDRIDLGAEYVYHRFGEVGNAAGSGRDADVGVSTLGLKLSFGF